MSLTVDGKPVPWNPPTTTVPLRADPTKLPVGDAREMSPESGWLALRALTKADDFDDTVRSDLA